MCYHTITQELNKFKKCIEPKINVKNSLEIYFVALYNCVLHIDMHGINITVKLGIV